MISCDRRPCLLPLAVLATILLLPAAATAFRPPEPGEELQEFTAPELRFGVDHQRLADAPQAVPRSDAWNAFMLRYGQETEVFIDPRSGVPANVVAAIPLLPGDGYRNQLSLDDVGTALGRPVDAVDAGVVADRVRQFVIDHRETFGIDGRELANLRATEVAEDFWMVHAERAVGGVPVRHAHLSAVVKHGNLILFGANVWGDVETPTPPAIDGSDAIDRGFAALGGTRPDDRFWREPELELIPTDAPSGYGYRLAWAFGFTRGDDPARWEVLVDARDGTVLALEDTVDYATGRVRGNVYPNTNTGICPTDVHGKVDFTRCGTMQSNYPMPWTDFAHLAAIGFTDGAGQITYPGGAATTTLTGSFINIADGCGAISESNGAGQISLGGVNGDHDCTAAGTSPGNTSAARLAFNEVGKTREAALGWLPGNVWLTNQLTVNTDGFPFCNAFWSGQISTFQSTAQCTNTGEVAGILDHEWGHGLDQNDATPGISSPGEAYADVAAIYRLQTSCVGYNFFNNFNMGCGMTSDGTGFNANEAQVGVAVCDLDCSGARDADWQMISLGAPFTPQNFVCPSCGGGSGPCGRQVHCSAAPPRQAAWDLAARDLQSAPHFYDTNSAFIVANRLFHQGSGNIVNWYECDCAAGTSAGCAATSAYMSWLAADDDNGNVLDGTPHMTAIYAAFDRHNIACQVPAPFDTGCFGGPTERPEVKIGATGTDITIKWTSVPGATEYWVMRSEGFTGCTQSKTRIARVNGFTYTDTEVLGGHQYCYSIVPSNGNEACTGEASICTCTTPARCGNTSVDVRLKETFVGGIPATWTVVDGGSGGGASATWNTANPCGLSIGPPIAAPWAEVNSQCAGVPATQNEELISPEVKIGGCGRVELTFAEQFAWNQAGRHEIADVDVMTFDSTNGWSDWLNVRRLENGSNGFPSPASIALDLTPQTRGETKLKLRFHYYDGSADGWWAVDNVVVQCRCPLLTPIPGPGPIPVPHDPSL